MKKLISMCAFATLAVSLSAVAQQEDEGGVKFRRNSLCLILATEKGENSEVIKEAFSQMAVPEKYDDFNVDVRHVVLDYDSLNLTNEDYQQVVWASLPDSAYYAQKAIGAEAPQHGSFMGSLAKEAGAGLLGSLTGGLMNENGLSGKDYEAFATRELNKNGIARKLYDKWLIDDEGALTFDKVWKKGIESATIDEQAANAVSAAASGLNAELGTELMGNTYVVMLRYRYIEKQTMLDRINANAQVVIDAFGGNMIAKMSVQAAIKGIVAGAAGSGHIIATTAYLFKLRFDDEKLRSLMDDKAVYDASDIFALQYVDKQTKWAWVKEKQIKDKSDEEKIGIATVVATDAALAKLSRGKKGFFRNRAELLVGVDAKGKPTYSAKIGTREGVEKGDQYAVYERVLDEKTGVFKNKRVATITATNQIWHNDFDQAFIDDAKSADAVDATYFQYKRGKGESDLYGGLIIEFIK